MPFLFFLHVNCISMPEKKKKSIKHRILNFFYVCANIWDHLNKNWLLDYEMISIFHWNIKHIFNSNFYHNKLHGKTFYVVKMTKLILRRDLFIIFPSNIRCAYFWRVFVNIWQEVNNWIYKSCCEIVSPKTALSNGVNLTPRNKFFYTRQKWSINLVKNNQIKSQNNLCCP